jgi:hypothetical protein
MVVACLAHANVTCVCPCIVVIRGEENSHWANWFNTQRFRRIIVDYPVLMSAGKQTLPTAFVSGFSQSFHSYSQIVANYAATSSSHTTCNSILAILQSFHWTPDYLIKYLQLNGIPISVLCHRMKSSQYRFISTILQKDLVRRGSLYWEQISIFIDIPFMGRATQRIEALRHQEGDYGFDSR